MELRRCTVGPWAMNAYALICPDTRQSVLIDPGDDPASLDQLLEGSMLQAILITHSHPDHIGALEEMRRKHNVPVMTHGSARLTGVDRHLFDGDQVDVGDCRIRVHHAPGHTPDQVCFRVKDGNQAIVGDTIFDGGPGKTWSARDFQTTLHTLRQVVLSWPDDTICYPGHGAHFRLGNIRGVITEFVAKDHGPFYGDARWEM